MSRRRVDLDSPGTWFGVLALIMGVMVLASLWLMWAVVALLIAGIAKLAHGDALAAAMIRSLNWRRSA